MMLLFSNKDKKQREPDPATDRKARAIARIIAKKQEKAAGWLNRKFGALPHPAQVICLLLFCLMLGGASGWILAQAVLPGPASGLKVVPNLPPKEHRQKLQLLPESLGHPDKH
ncbi:hypothetical protein [Pontibacter pamirensis]|uniref:hypothetical protein n=1 Tax=Pontibacter pamirensis TaxID=2562824 RepID=UPI001389CDC7|nr:hypothetical protein [Pontibacter pamirensis]